MPRGEDQMVSRRAALQMVAGMPVDYNMSVELQHVEVQDVDGWFHSQGNQDPHRVMDAHTGVAGVCHARGANANIPPVWLVYFTVADLAAATVSWGVCAGCAGAASLRLRPPAREAAAPASAAAAKSSSASALGGATTTATPRSAAARASKVPME